MSAQHMALDAFILKVAAVMAGVSAAVIPSNMTLYFITSTVPFFNVGISTFGMSAAGSMLAFAYGTPIESRKKLYGYAVGGTFIGIWGLQLMMWQGVDVPHEFRPPVAGAMALLSRWVVPFIVDNFMVIGARIFGRQPPKGEE